MLWLLILKLSTLRDSLLDYFVSVQLLFNKMADGQWNLVYLSANPTAKGNAALGAFATIVHNVRDFVAQFTTLFPAPNGEWLNTPTV
jgi:hypothetical protein